MRVRGKRAIRSWRAWAAGLTVAALTCVAPGANATSPRPALGSAAQAATLAPPTILGTPALGADLRPGVSLPAGTVYTPTWLRNGVPIVGALPYFYTVSTADFDTDLSLRVSVTSPDGTTQVAESAPAHIATIVARTPSGIGVSPIVGQPLGSRYGPTSAGGNTLTYQWFRGLPGASDPPQPILGQTSVSFLPTASDMGDLIFLQVSATSAAGLSVTGPLTAKLLPVLGDIQARGADLTTRAASVGRPLSVVGTTWTTNPVTTPTQSIQWLRNNVPIPGATNSTYVPTDEDRANLVSATVEVSAPGYRKSSPTSPAVRVPSRTFLNGDDIRDLVARDASGYLFMYGATTAGRFTPRQQVGSGWNSMTSIVSVGDFNLDGVNDLVARQDTGALWLYQPNGLGGWKPRSAIGTGWISMTAIVGPGDFDGDLAVDLIARDTSGKLWLCPGSGTGLTLPRIQIGSGWNSMTAIIAPGDWNRDGHVDLLARDTTGTLWLYPGDGRRGFGARVQIGIGWNIMTVILDGGDFNRDGSVDLIARDTAGALWLYPSNGSTGFKPRVQIGAGWNIYTKLA